MFFFLLFAFTMIYAVIYMHGKSSQGKSSQAEAS